MNIELNHKAEANPYASKAWVRELQEELAINEQRIRAASLAEGWDLVHHRGRTIRAALQAFFEEVVRETSPRGAVAIHALGGTGRQEICPGSDIDLGIIVENVEENEHFLRHVVKHLQWLAAFMPGLANTVKANAITELKDSGCFEIASLASLLDADLLVGDPDFDHRIRNICRERAAELGLEFIFSINQDLQHFDRTLPQLPGDISGFDVKKGRGGLRNFQMTMWLYSFERWLPSVDVYEQARNSRRFESEGAPTEDVLDAAGVLFSVRCWLELRRADPTQDTAGRRTLFMDASDMADFQARFGAEGLTRLNTAREAIIAYRGETLDRLLERGVVVPNSAGLVVWGANGLRVKSDALFRDATETFFSIYAAQQRYQLPIDPSVIRAARKNIPNSLRPHAGFIGLLIAEGPVVPALKDWFEFGVLGRLAPRFDALLNSLYKPGHRAATLTLAARALQRVENLERLATLEYRDRDVEQFFVRQYKDLGPSARCALRLTLLVEEVPETIFPELPYNEAVERYVKELLAPTPALSGPTRRTIRYLLLMKRELIRASETGDQEQVVARWRQQITALDSQDSIDTIRALALFTYAAFDFRSNDGKPRLAPEQWRSIKNLAENLLLQELDVTSEAFHEHNFDELGQRIGSLLPRRLLAGPHVDKTPKQDYDGNTVLDPRRADHIISRLKEVVQQQRPLVLMWDAGGYFAMFIFGWDFPGLFWRVAGALYEMHCSIRSTDLYEISDPNGTAVDGETRVPGEPQLIFDALTFDAPKNVSEVWEHRLRDSIIHRLQHRDEEIEDRTGEILAPVMDQLEPKLTELGQGQWKFSCHLPADLKGTRYAITRILSERIGADFESIAQDGTRDWPVPRINFYFRAVGERDTIAAMLRSAVGPVTTVVDTLT